MRFLDTATTATTTTKRVRTTTAVAGVLAALGLLVAPAVTESAPRADAALRQHVTTDYTLLRRAPASYVLGTAYRDWTVDVHGEGSSGYRWGRVFGDLNSCLWIYDGAVDGSGATTDSCPAGGRVIPESEFTNGQIGGGAADGAAVATVAGAGCATWDGTHLVAYGNVRPWEVPTTPSAQINTPVPMGGTVLWRYVSRDGAYVMVRDPNGGSTDGVGQQSWFFLPRGCLPTTLP